MGSKRKRPNENSSRSRRQRRRQSTGCIEVKKTYVMQGKKDMPTEDVQVLLSHDSAWLFVVFFAILYRNYMYPKWWYDIQMGRTYVNCYNLFMLIMRCIGARLCMPDDRHMLVRIFFVAMQNTIPLFFGNILYQQGLTQEFINQLCVTVTLASFFTSLLVGVPKSRLLNYKELILIC